MILLVDHLKTVLPHYSKIIFLPFQSVLTRRTCRFVGSSYSVPVWRVFLAVAPVLCFPFYQSSSKHYYPGYQRQYSLKTQNKARKSDKWSSLILHLLCCFEWFCGVFYGERHQQTINQASQNSPNHSKGVRWVNFIHLTSFISCYSVHRRENVVFIGDLVFFGHSKKT